MKGKSDTLEDYFMRKFKEMGIVVVPPGKGEKAKRGRRLRRVRPHSV
jgi:hypothetical protein